MKVFLDTNVLIYAFEDIWKADIADRLMAEPFVVGVQTLNEFANVAIRKLRMTLTDVYLALDRIEGLATTMPPTELSDLRAGLDIAQRYRLSIFDALMLAIALRAGCTVFYSEDMHHGLVIEGQLTIANPFL
mgnify:CR=1 FL=1